MVDPLRRSMTIAYEQGTATLSVGLFRFMFPEGQELIWENPAGGVNPLTGRKFYKYGRRQRSLSAGGKVVTVRLDDGNDYNIRYTGDVTNVIDCVQRQARRNRVVGAWTRKGTVCGAQFPPQPAT